MKEPQLQIQVKKNFLVITLPLKEVYEQLSESKIALEISRESINGGK